MLTTPHFLFSEHSPQYVANVSFLHLLVMCTIFGLCLSRYHVLIKFLYLDSQKSQGLKMKYRITMTRMLTMMLMDHLGDKKSLKKITLWAVVRPVFGINISRYISPSFQGISWISCAESETLSICKHALAYRDSRTNWSWSTTHTSGHEILLRRCSIQ